MDKTVQMNYLHGYALKCTKIYRTSLRGQNIYGRIDAIWFNLREKLLSSTSPYWHFIFLCPHRHETCTKSHLTLTYSLFLEWCRTWCWWNKGKYVQFSKSNFFSHHIWLSIPQAGGFKPASAALLASQVC